MMKKAKWLSAQSGKTSSFVLYNGIQQYPKGSLVIALPVFAC